MINSPAQVAENFVAAWNKANADEIAELFSEDADFVNVVGLWWNSRKQIRDAHAYGFDRMFPDTVMTLNKVTTRLLGVDVAVVHAAWTMEGQITPQVRLPSNSGHLMTMGHRLIKEDVNHYV
ncbi:SgcJ/EcaC family oxidoreductase, partial [Corynebacterium callunae]|uniref:SgcJ/EcaC family oxidoreductase n=1 Tax=Corynebacterium callunae TaxID=1721 RepID=UPI001FFF77D7